jgi:diguanylate cyclase (GGDEF)-like protein/PAS domain S-box-containing protein
MAATGSVRICDAITDSNVWLRNPCALPQRGLPTIGTLSHCMTMDATANHSPAVLSTPKALSRLGEGLLLAALFAAGIGIGLRHGAAADTGATGWILLVGAILLVLAATYTFVRLRQLQAAEMRRDHVLTLARENEQLTSIIEGTDVGTWVANMRTRELIVNERFIEMLGYRREELSPMTVNSWMQLLHPDDYDMVTKTVRAEARRAGTVFNMDFRLRHKDGHWLWIVSRGRAIEHDALNRPARIVGYHVDISDRKVLEQRLVHAATRDAVTGLANRSRFMEQLQRTMRAGSSGRPQQFCVLFLDFDHFKLINDSMGHEAGDEMLREIATRLQEASATSRSLHRPGAEPLVARFGGDEFLILMPGIRSLDEAQRLADHVQQSLAAPFCVAGQQVHVAASIGVVMGDDPALDAATIIRNADMAMYDAKRNGRGRSVLYEESMLARLTRRVAIEKGLRAAIGTPALRLVYQPIVELQTGRTSSVEALIRWEDPELGEISPSEFIPIAEQSDVICSIGSWVLREACLQLAAWRRERPDLAPATISVNVSRAELSLGPALLDRVRRMLQETGLPAQCLQLEVTEREVMRDPTASLDLMRQLREIGVKLAMDDFGTGMSSLGCLHQYPFDVIKIDRAFVNGSARDPNLMAVLHATVTLIENLEMDSVAEGVERHEELAVLLSMGCRHAQGYFLGRPGPAEQILRTR